MERFQTLPAAVFNPADMFKSALPSDSPVKITGIIPRVREGGVYVRFSHDATITPKQVEHTVKDYLKTHQPRPLLSPFSTRRVGLVRGRPWVEDLLRLPTQRLRAVSYTHLTLPTKRIV